MYSKLLRPKVLLILPPNLPVPAVDGGAIETIVTQILRINEEQKRLDLHVCSIYSKEALAEGKQFKQSTIHFVKLYSENVILRNMQKAGSLISCIFRRHFLKRLDPLTITTSYYRKAFRIAEEIAPDIVIAEGGDYEEFAKYSERIGRQRCAIHIHHELKDHNALDEVFGFSISVSKYIDAVWMQSISNKMNHYIVPNGIAIDDFCKPIPEEEIAAKRLSLGYKNDDFIVLYCGRIIKEKGVAELISAINSICDSNVKLLLIGSVNFADGGSSQYFEQIKRAADILSDRISYLGYIPNKCLQQYYELADILVVPSICEEACGLVALEGMAAGKPLIITNSGGMVEYVASDNAIIVEIDDDLPSSLAASILELIKKPRLCIEMGDASRRRAEEFSSEEMYNQFATALEMQLKTCE